ncbi:hypothetical protein B0H16DRAFT_1425101, partial [Mycena metata]
MNRSPMTDVEMPAANTGGSKRQREGSPERSSHSAKRTAVASQEASTAGSPAATSIWMMAIQQCTADRVRVPPALVLEEFCNMHDEALKEFQTAQKQYQKALITLERFTQASENDATPAIVSNAIKAPTVQLLKGTPNFEHTDGDTNNVKSIMDEAIAAARKNAVAFLTATYVAQVEHCKSSVDVKACADALASAFKAYAKEIIESAQLDGDVHIWDTCIARLRITFEAELTNLSFDFAAKVRQEAASKEAKANAVESARLVVQEEGQDGQEGAEEGRQERRPRRRKRRNARAAQGQEGQGQGEGEGQRPSLAPIPAPPLHDVSSWVSPPGSTFHHHRPDTYPDVFFNAPPDVRTRFVTSQMSELYYDTRLINRAFHNLTDVPLPENQQKLLALNPKF